MKDTPKICNSQRAEFPSWDLYPLPPTAEEDLEAEAEQEEEEEETPPHVLALKVQKPSAGKKLEVHQ